jgi:hypothetical protein
MFDLAGRRGGSGGLLANLQRSPSPFASLADAKQNTVKGTNPSKAIIMLSKLFLLMVSVVPPVGLCYAFVLVSGVRIEDGTCMPKWEAWAPLLLCIADSSCVERRAKAS